MISLETETWRGIPATEPRIRSLIADDQPIIRKQVRSILEEHPSFEVCGEVQDGARSIEQAQRLKPDVVILNISMPVLNGLEAVRQIKVKLPGFGDCHTVVKCG
jgi:DNA-binding NarL/FixJ family response regulator